MPPKRDKRIQIMADAWTLKNVRAIAERTGLTPSEIGHRIIRQWLLENQATPTEAIQKLMIVTEEVPPSDAERLGVTKERSGEHPTNARP